MTKDQMTITEEMKGLLSDPKNRIELEDYVSKHVESFLRMTNVGNFPVQGVGVQKENFLDRMQKYEDATKDLQKILILLARWGDQEHLLLLKKIFIRLAESEKGSAGTNVWLHLEWYPTQILMYAAGISALSADKFEALKIILSTPVLILLSEKQDVPLIVAVTSNIFSELGDVFKWIPGQEKKYFPRSEHFFGILRSPLEESLFLGKGYEQLFDDFEVYAALVYSDLTGRDWAPIGRFGWKHSRAFGDSSFHKIIEEAKERKEEWLPLKVGMFKGSLSRFLEISNALEKQIRHLSWW